jgi:hypothetical protein
MFRLKLAICLAATAWIAIIHVDLRFAEKQPGRGKKLYLETIP